MASIRGTAALIAAALRQLVRHDDLAPASTAAWHIGLNEPSFDFMMRFPDR